MAQFTNQATISYNGITVNSNIVTGEITQVLTAWKRATTDSYRPGEVLTYVVNIQNAGNTDFTNLTITDDLGAYTVGTTDVTPLIYTGDAVLYSINGVIQPSPAVTAGPPMAISGINVPAGGSAEVIYRALAGNTAPLGADGTVTNTAAVTGAGVTEPLSASFELTANTAPQLSIFKELSPTTVVENGEVTYTFTIQNTGATATTAADDIVINDIFTPILSEPLRVTLNGAVWAQDGNYTYDAGTGAFATVPGAVTVPAATYIQDPDTGVWSITPGTTVLTVTGNL